MGLNIKNEETQKLVRELARLTGESMTAAITEAVRERLDRVRSERGAGLAERLTTTRGCRDDRRVCNHRHPAG